MTERVKIYSSDGISLVIPEKQDMEIFYQHVSDPKFNQYIGPFAKINSRESQEKYYETINKDDKNATFHIYDEEKEVIIGNVELLCIDYIARKADLGIVILNIEHTNKGVGTIVVTMILKHAFEVLGLNKVGLQVLAGNLKAIRCYEKCGFHEIGRQKDECYRMGKYHDLVLMEIFNKSNNYDGKNKNI